MTELTLRPRTLALGLVGRPYAYRRDMLLQEDMSGYVTLEDGTGRVLLETDGEGDSLGLNARQTDLTLRSR